MGLLSAGVGTCRQTQIEENCREITESQAGKLGWHQEGQTPPHSDPGPSRDLRGAISCQPQLPQLHSVAWENPQRTHQGQGGRGGGCLSLSLSKEASPGSFSPALPLRLALPGGGPEGGCLEWRQWPVSSIPRAPDSSPMGIATWGFHLSLSPARLRFAHRGSGWLSRA